MKKTITINRIKFFFSKQKDGLKKEGNEFIRTDVVNIQIPENKLISFEREMAKIQGANKCMSYYSFDQKLPICKGKTDDGKEFDGFLFQELKNHVILIKYQEETNAEGILEDVMYSCRVLKESLEFIEDINQ